MRLRKAYPENPPTLVVGSVKRVYNSSEVEMEGKDIKVWECLRCGHKWANRKSRKPGVCPNCHSYLWDEKRDSKNGAE